MMPRRCWLLVGVALLFVSAGCLGGIETAPESDAQTVTVTRVIDGDTLEVAYGNGTTDTVRLLGVDTPEVHVEVDPSEFAGVPANASGRCWLRAWGHDASGFAERELAGEQVTLTFDETEDRRGYYGRLLAYVSHENASFNAALVDHGYARVYAEGSASRESEYLALERRAQRGDRGVWGYRADSALTDCE